MNRALRPIPVLPPRAFSLIELVIVVVIIGIVAAIAVPRFSRASIDARDTAFVQNIVTVQRAIDHYTAEHADRSPAIGPSGAIDPVGVNFIRRLVQTTDDTGATGTIFGPYLADWPVNPVNNKKSLRIDGAAAGANTHGWRFDTTTGDFESDHLTSIVVRVPKGVIKPRAVDLEAVVEAE